MVFSIFQGFLKEFQKDEELPTEFVKSIDITRTTKKLETSNKFKLFLSLFNWYPSHYSSYERKFLFKVDVCVLIYVSFSFYTRYLDLSNLTNAYVTGMKEELQLYGNELNYFNTCFSIGYAVGQIPLMFLINKKGWARYLLIICELCWCICTFVTAQVSNAKQLYAIRFFIGLSESVSFPGAYVIMSSWYTPDELFKRAGFYNFMAGIGSLSSGFIQAGVRSSMDGKLSWSGWRWQFIIDGLITLCVLMYGVLMFPGVPSLTRQFSILNQDDLVLARKRVDENNISRPKNWSIDVFKEIFTSWHWWLLVPFRIIFCLCFYDSAFALYLKSEPTIYTVAQRNTYPTGVSLLSAVCNLIGTSLVSVIGLPLVATFFTLFGYLHAIILTVWNVPRGLHLFAYYCSGPFVSLAPVFFLWSAMLCNHNAEKKAIVLACLNGISFAFTAFVPIFLWDTSLLPQYKSGFRFVLGMTILCHLVFFVIWYIQKYEEKKKKMDDEDEVSVEEIIILPEKKMIDS